MTLGANGPDAAPRRRDAQRNRELLVEAAREVFAEQGLDAPLDVIARRAGVGNATLYRHFPSRAALVDEVFQDTLTGTMAVGERARTAEDAWTALLDYTETVFTGLAADRGAIDLMTTRLEGVATLEAVHAHNRETVDALLRRGREQGTVRGDLSTEDLLFALAALSAPSRRSPPRHRTPGAARSPSSSTACAPPRPPPRCPSPRSQRPNSATSWGTWGHTGTD